MALSLLSRGCGSGRHEVCLNNLTYFKQSMANLNKINFVKFIDAILSNGNYNCCLLNHYNKNSNDIINFIILASGLIEIPANKLISICQHIPGDIETKKIIENQIKLNEKYKEELINCKNATGYYGSIIHFIPQCINLKKINTFKYALENLDINIFVELLKQIRDSIPLEYEKHLSDYITKNSEHIKISHQIINLVDALVNKPTILKIMFKSTNLNLKADERLDILNKVVSGHSQDASLILLIMEGGNVIPNNITIINLLSKAYFRSIGSPNAKVIAEIIDIFILYGFKISKDIVIMLLRKGCYVNSIESHQITIDESILEVCAELSYYPYDFNCIPPHKVMLKECSKDNNLEQLKKLREKGGVINTECLANACGVRKNGKIIKYIINECKVKPNDTCLEKFQNIYGIETLDLLMQNYSNTKEQPNKNNNKINLDSSSTMSIDKKNIEINNDTEYILKNKVKIFFNYNKKTIKYLELYELMLKYLINHKLVIGNYFVINDELCNLLKINQCTLVNIDQIDNILTYFIDVNK
jgi:hypothetical protein